MWRRWISCKNCNVESFQKHRESTRTRWNKIIERETAYKWAFVVVVQSLSCPTLCNPTNCSMPSFPVLHYLLEFAKTHVHWVSEAIQPSHLLSAPLSSLGFNLSQHQSLFQWVSSLHQVAKVLELWITGYFLLQRNCQFCFELRVRVGPCAEPLLQRSRKAICIVCIWN